MIFIFNFLQATAQSTQPSVVENFFSTLLASGILLTIAAFFYNKNEKNKEDRLIKAEEKAQKSIDKAEKIEKNYIQRFEEVNEKVDETKREIIGHFDRKMEKVADRVDRLSEEKNTWRLGHTEKLTRIQSDVQHLTEEIRRSNTNNR